MRELTRLRGHPIPLTECLDEKTENRKEVLGSRIWAPNNPLLVNKQQRLLLIRPVLTDMEALGPTTLRGSVYVMCCGIPLAPVMPPQYICTCTISALCRGRAL